MTQLSAISQLNGNYNVTASGSDAAFLAVHAFATVHAATTHSPSLFVPPPADSSSIRYCNTRIYSNCMCNICNYKLQQCMKCLNCQIYSKCQSSTSDYSYKFRFNTVIEYCLTMCKNPVNIYPVCPGPRKHKTRGVMS